EEDRNLALEPRDTLELRTAPTVAAAPTDVPSDAIYLYGAMARAAQMAGALEACLVQSVRYATERKQFGRPIGSFQAIQQNLAVLAGHVPPAGHAPGAPVRAPPTRRARLRRGAGQRGAGQAGPRGGR